MFGKSGSRVLWTRDQIFEASLTPVAPPPITTKVNFESGIPAGSILASS
jgi:hypothetical protein